MDTVFSIFATALKNENCPYANFVALGDTGGGPYDTSGASDDETSSSSDDDRVGTMASLGFQWVTIIKGTL